jgi:hypothetical protein
MASSLHFGDVIGHHQFSFRRGQHVCDSSCSLSCPREILRCFGRSVVQASPKVPGNLAVPNFRMGPHRPAWLCSSGISRPGDTRVEGPCACRFSRSLYGAPRHHRVTIYPSARIPSIKFGDKSVPSASQHVEPAHLFCDETLMPSLQVTLAQHADTGTAMIGHGHAAIPVRRHQLLGTDNKVSGCATAAETPADGARSRPAGLLVRLGIEVSGDTTCELHPAMNDGASGLTARSSASRTCLRRGLHSLNQNFRRSGRRELPTFVCDSDSGYRRPRAVRSCEPRGVGQITPSSASFSTSDLDMPSRVVRSHSLSSP